MPRRTPYRDPILVEVLAYLGAGRIEARQLLDEDAPEDVRIYGVCESGVSGRTVTIDEGEHIVETLLHEILHAVRPQWTEQGVRRRTTQLYRQLSQAERAAIYACYLGVTRRRAGPKVV